MRRSKLLGAVLLTRAHFEAAPLGRRFGKRRWRRRRPRIDGEFGSLLTVPIRNCKGLRGSPAKKDTFSGENGDFDQKIAANPGIRGDLISASSL